MRTPGPTLSVKPPQWIYFRDRLPAVGEWIFAASVSPRFSVCESEGVIRPLKYKEDFLRAGGWTYWAPVIGGLPDPPEDVAFSKDLDTYEEWSGKFIDRPGDAGIETTLKTMIKADQRFPFLAWRESRIHRDAEIRGILDNPHLSSPDTLREIRKLLGPEDAHDTILVARYEPATGTTFPKRKATP